MHYFRKTFLGFKAGECLPFLLTVSADTTVYQGQPFKLFQSTHCSTHKAFSFINTTHKTHNISVLASNQRIFGRVIYFMKLAFHFWKQKSFAFTWLATFAFTQQRCYFDSLTTKLKLINKVWWPMCQFFYFSSLCFSWQFANISPVEKKLETQSKTIFPS